MTVVAAALGGAGAAPALALRGAAGHAWRRAREFPGWTARRVVRLAHDGLALSHRSLRSSRRARDPSVRAAIAVSRCAAPRGAFAAPAPPSAGDHRRAQSRASLAARRRRAHTTTTWWPSRTTRRRSRTPACDEEPSRGAGTI